MKKYFRGLLFGESFHSSTNSSRNVRYRYTDGSSGAQGETGTGGEAGSSGAETGTAADGGAAGTGATGQGDQSKQTVTYTQADFSKKMAAEKEQGRQAALTELGITDPAQAKTLLEMAGKLADATKPGDQKLSEEALKTQEALKRAEIAENKIVLVTEKAKSEFLDDVLILATMRVNEKTDFKAAVEAVRKLHPNMFSEGEAGSQGTGTPPGGKKKSGAEVGAYGKRAAAAVPKAPVKSSYFSQT